MKKKFLAYFFASALGLAQADAQQLLQHAGKATYAVAGTSTWDPSNKGTSIVLSGGNLIATNSTSAGAWNMVRGTSSYTVGTNHKVVFSVTMPAFDPNFGWSAGVADNTATLSTQLGTTGFAGGFTPFVGFAVHGTGVTINNNCGGANATPPSGVLYWAVDFNTGNVYCSSDCLTWSGSTPDSGTSNAIVIPAGTYFPAWSGQNNGGTDTGTLSTTPSLGSCTGVTTFTTWG